MESYTCLGIDPGAKKLGWAFVQQQGRDGYTLLDSGVYHIERGNSEKYGEYRRRLIEYWSEEFINLVGRFNQPDLIYSEILPVTNGGAAQRILALTVATVIHSRALLAEIPYREVGATTVKKKVAGSGTATKVKIRDVVISVFPQLEPRKRELTVVPDETDAIAIALLGCGYGEK